MAKYHKASDVIDAIQWTGNNLKEVIKFTGKHPRWDEWFSSWERYENHVHESGGIYKILTPEGTISAAPGDWIIRDVSGDLSSCKPNIFNTTYEAVHED